MMMENIAWEQWYKDLLTQYYGHAEAENKYRRLHRGFGIPVVIVTTVVSTAAFASLSKSPPEQHLIIPIFVGGLSVVAAILSSLQTFLRYAELAEGHDTAKDKCGRLKLEFEQRMLVGRNRELVEFIEEVTPEWCNIQEESPNIDADIYQRAQKRAEKRLKDIRENSFEEIRCEGTLEDLYLSDAGEMKPMPAERRWEYELGDVVIKKYPHRLSLSYAARVKYPDSEKVEVYTSYGTGSFIDGIAYLEYSFNSQDGSTSWNGVMVLRIPRRGEVKGFWLTTNVHQDARFPMGSITLRRLLGTVSEA